MYKLAYIRFYQEPKLVYSKNYLFLTKHHTPTKIITGCLLKKGFFKYYYKIVTKSYNYFLNYYKKNKSNLFFLFFFSLTKDYLYYNLDYALFNWSKPWLSLFRLEKIKSKKTYKNWIRYVKLRRRYLLVWRWISLLVQCLKLKYTNWYISFLNLWQELFLQPTQETKFISIKLRVYKIYLYKLY